LTVPQPDDQIVRAPKHLSFEEIATLPTAGGTAMNALLNGPEIGPGVTIVTQGTGSVSNFAIQVYIINIRPYPHP
jgi:NADPH:quinone reductase-like Zn-dependent oxidoreductase